MAESKDRKPAQEPQKLPDPKASAVTEKPKIAVTPTVAIKMSHDFRDKPKKEK